MKQTLLILLASATVAWGQNYKWVNFAGLPGTPGDVDGGTGTSRLNGTYGADCDSSGNVFIADRVNNKIKKITSGGTVSTLSVSGFCNRRVDCSRQRNDTSGVEGEAEVHVACTKRR